MGSSGSKVNIAEPKTAVMPTMKSPIALKQHKSTKRLSEISRKSEGRDSFEKTSETIHHTKPRKSLREVLGSRNDLRQFRSKEVSARLHKKLLTEIDHKKGYTWQGDLHVDVASQEAEVTAKVFLLPDIAAEEGRVTTLLVIVIVQESLLARLREQDEDCWIAVESEVMDTYAGKRMDFMECALQRINTNSHTEGVNFYQKLLSCSEVLHSEGEEMELILRATIAIAKRSK